MNQPYKVGEASWDEEQVSSNNRERRKPLPILKMSNNTSYTVRIISKPYRYYAKWVETANKKKIKLNSSLTPDCPLCQDGEQPKMGRYIRVLYRDPTGKVEFRVMDIGSQIYTGITAIQKIPEFGKDPSKYYVTITKGPQGAQPLYTVNGLPPSEMTEADKAIAKQYGVKGSPDYFDLEEYCKPLPPETIRKILTGAPSAAKGGKATKPADPEAGLFEGAEEGEAETPPAVVAAAAPVAAKAVEAPAKTAKAAPAAGKDEFLLDF